MQERTAFVAEVHRDAVAKMSVIRERCSAMRAELAELKSEYNAKVDKINECEDTMADAARDTVMLAQIRRCLTNDCVSLAGYVAKEIEPRLRLVLPRGRGHGFTLSTANGGKINDTSKWEMTDRKEASPMLCGDCTRQRTREVWLEFVGSTRRCEDVTVDNILDGENITPRDDSTSDSRFADTAAVQRTKLNTGLGYVFNCENHRLEARLPLVDLRSMLRSWQPQHRTLQQHVTLRNTWQSCLRTIARVYTHALLDHADPSIARAFVKAFGSSVAEEHRLDVFFETVLMKASPTRLWRMLRWLHKAVAVADNPLGGEIVADWPLEENEYCDFDYMSRIIKKLGLPATLFGLLCAENDAQPTATNHHHFCVKQSSHAAGPAGVSEIESAHYRATVNGKECVVGSNYRRELQWVLMSHMLVAEATKVTTLFDTHHNQKIFPALCHRVAHDIASLRGRKPHAVDSARDDDSDGGEFKTSTNSPSAHTNFIEPDFFETLSSNFGMHRQTLLATLSTLEKLNAAVDAEYDEETAFELDHHYHEYHR